MRILVGTLYSNEAEFDDCRKMINNQTYKNFEHIIIEGLSSEDAHNKLYTYFMENSDEYDILIKVDADMILNGTNIFRDIVQEFEINKELDNLTMPLFDFYMQSTIYGMQAYRNTVKWHPGKNNMFPDTIFDPLTIKNRIIWEKVVGNHCLSPNPLQAFHYGFHRALKAVQPGRIKARLDGNWKTIKQIYSNIDKDSDFRIMYALCGAEECFSGYYTEGFISYNKKIDAIFNNKYFGKTKSELFSFILKKRNRRLGFLPYPYDYGYLFFKFRLISIMNRNIK